MKSRAFFQCLKSLGYDSIPVVTSDNQVADEVINVVSDLSMYHKKFQKIQAKIWQRLWDGQKLQMILGNEKEDV